MDNYSLASRILAAITWIGFFTSIILSYYFYLKFKNKERLALIEKGVDIAEILKKADAPFRFPWLRLGMLVLGMGIGLFAGYLVIFFSPPPFLRTQNSSEVVIMLSSLLIFGGLGLVIGDHLERSRNKKNG
jgi:O-antigen/teichoic acid export membrane protein